MSQSKDQVKEVIGYTLSEGGTIQDPGKFEGCFWPAVIFYEHMLDGMADVTLWNENETVDAFFVEPGEIKEFELPEDTDAVTIWENDQGFVYFSQWNKEQYEKLAADLEEMETDEWSR